MDIKKYYTNEYVKEMEDDYRSNYAERILRQVRKHKDSGKLLDLGCGSGMVMKLAEEKYGFESYGIDINEAMIFKGVKKDRVIIDEITDLYQYKDKFFDVIVATNIIEHVQVPAETLENMKRILKDDGVIVISVPNIDAWIGKDEIVTEGHINYFNYNSLKAHCDRLGLRIVYKKSRLITAFLFRLFRKHNVSCTNICNPNKKEGKLNKLYDLVEKIDITNRGIDLQLHIKKDLKWEN